MIRLLITRPIADTVLAEARARFDVTLGDAPLSEAAATAEPAAAPAAEDAAQG